MDEFSENRSDLDHFISRTAWFACSLENNETAVVYGIDFTADIDRINDHISVTVLDHETGIREKINIPSAGFRPVDIVNLVRTTLKKILILE